MKPTLLLLPGMLCDEAFWRAQIEALSDICTPLVPAYGESDSIGAMAARVLDGAPHRFALAGHSMGGRVAIEICRIAPARVERLALLCTDYRGHLSEQSRETELRERRDLLTIAQQQGMRALARQWFAGQIAAGSAANAALLTALADMGARHSPDRLAAEIHAGLTRPDQAEVLPHIICPTLVCAGEEDRLRPVGLHEEMARQVAEARLVVIPRAGHMVAMEQPEAVNAALRNWLRQ